MIRTPQSDRTRTRLARWAVGVAVAGAVSVGAVSGGVDAARRTSSETVAAEATRALESLDRWNAIHHPADYVQFVRSRDRAARLTANELDADPAALERAWAVAPVEKQQAVLAAMSQLGVPYRSLESEPGVGFDCSGLTIWAFAQAGFDIPRVSRDQIRDAAAVAREVAEAGDLVYYPGHVGIYLGAELYVHSPNSGNTVEAVHLPTKSLRFGDATIDD